MSLHSFKVKQLNSTTCTTCNYHIW